MVSIIIINLVLRINLLLRVMYLITTVYTQSIHHSDYIACCVDIQELLLPLELDDIRVFKGDISPHDISNVVQL